MKLDTYKRGEDEVEAKNNTSEYNFLYTHDFFLKLKYN